MTLLKLRKRDANQISWVLLLIRILLSNGGGKWRAKKKEKKEDWLPDFSFLVHTKMVSTCLKKRIPYLLL